MHIAWPQLQVELEWGKTSVFFSAFSFWGKPICLLKMWYNTDASLPASSVTTVTTFGSRHRSHWNHVSTNFQGGQIDVSDLSERCVGSRVLCWDWSRETTLTVLRARSHQWDPWATISCLDDTWCFLSVWRVEQAMLLLPTAFAR